MARILSLLIATFFLLTASIIAQADGCSPPDENGNIYCYGTLGGDDIPPPVSHPSRPAPPPVATAPTPPVVEKVPLDADDWQECAGSTQTYPSADAKACYKITQDSHTTTLDFAMAAALLAQAHYHAGDYQSTITTAGYAIDVNGTLALPYLVRGEANFQLDHYSNAISDYNHAIANYSKPTGTTFRNKRNLSEFYNDRALALQFMNRKAEAAKDYRRALAIEPGSSFATNHLDQLPEDQQQEPQVSDSCILLGPPIHGGVGCGGGKEWFWTQASIKRVQGCPQDMLIEYLAPDTSQFEEISIPARLQTCGVGVSVARSKE